MVDFAQGTKLHLGAGGKRIAGYLNTDFEPSRAPDLVLDALSLTLPENTFSVIYASHLLEHVWPEDVVPLLRHWHDALEVDGVLRLSVPDLRLIVENCVETQRFGPDPNAPLFGWYHKDAPEHERHKQVFWFERLSELLAVVGFDVRPWRVDEYPEIAAVKDWASYETISLNLEGRKGLKR